MRTCSKVRLIKLLVGILSIGFCGINTALADKQGAGAVEFTVDGQKVKTNVWVLNHFGKGADYNFTSNMHLDKRSIGLNFRDPVEGKTLKFSGMMSGNYGSYFELYGDTIKNWRIVSGSITVIHFDKAAKKMSAGFEIEVQSIDQRKQKIKGNFTNGNIGEESVILFFKIKNGRQMPPVFTFKNT